VSLDRPYAMVGANVFAADTDVEAQRLFTSLQQQFLNLVRGTPGQIPPPIDSMDGRWSPPEQAHIDRMTRVSLVGSPDTVRERLTKLLAETGADEIIVAAQIYDHAARLRSLEILAEVRDSLAAAGPQRSDVL
jgi:alkanesulfonate monooxygenase SsuD/methylene tetrahydromethanopterin reductase-like flavin-dependent oxidoreductase (luciferase family)